MADVPDRLKDALAGRYRIERLLGSGGMADVYVAQDLKHPRRAAIKVLKPELAALLGRERFLLEIECSARLQHPYIVALWDSGATGDLLYYVMPFLEGDTLRQRLEREKQLPLEEAARITGEVAEALDYAHHEGVVHRDIKPENILFEGGHALVADFGIARAVGLAGGTQLTETGVSLGTPAYMSTEQALGGRELDGRSDQYSLACVAYEMLAGQPPFTGATAESVVHQHVAAPPRPVTDLRPAVSAGVAAALSRALAKAPADRFASTGEFARALKVAAGEVSAIETPLTHVPPRARRQRLALAAAGLVVAAAALTTWWWIEFRGRPAVADPTQKDLILVAQFEGPADDPGLAPAVRDMLTSAIDQSGIAATVADIDLRQALRVAGKPDTTRVDATLAHELAYRRSIRAVLEGRVSRVGTGYSVTARVVDVEDSDRLLLSTGETAADQKRLIPAIERLGHRLRGALGERRAALKASRPLMEAATPDFEAYRLYIRGSELNKRGDFVGATRLLRAAIARDAQFGAAWRSLGANLFNQGKLDSCEWALDEALRHAGRLDDYDRASVESLLGQLHRDLGAMLSPLERALESSLTPSQLARILTQRSMALGNAGRYEEACESSQLAVRAWPFGPGEATLSNLSANLMRLGRFDEALEVERRRRDPREPLARLEIFREQWARAESMGTVVASDVALPLGVRSSGAVWAASACAARGQVARSARTLDVARRLAESASDNTSDIRDIGDIATELAMYSGRPVPAIPVVATDTSFDGEIVRALQANLSGQRTEATGTLQRLLADPRSRRAVYTVRIALIRGWTALGKGRDDEATAWLQPLALETGGPFYDWYRDLDARQRARWLMVGVYERLGRPDSAAVCLELLLAPLGRYRDLIPWRGVHFSFAHQRLVLLYARMGQLDAARRHWEIFQKSFDDPDPELRPLVDEARNALAAAEGMAKGSRP